MFVNCNEAFSDIESIYIIGCTLSPHKLQKYCHQLIKTIFISYVDVVHILCIPCVMCMQSKNKKMGKNEIKNNNKTIRRDTMRMEKGPHFETRFGCSVQCAHTLSITMLTLISARLNYAIAIKIKGRRQQHGKKPPRTSFRARNVSKPNETKKTDTFFNISRNYYYDV